MPLGLRQHTLARIDQDYGELAGRGAGRHVARVLLVPRRIGHGEGTLLGREKPVGDIDRDLCWRSSSSPSSNEEKSKSPAAVPDRRRNVASWSSRIRVQS
jgi:hypothetical protein